MKPMKKIVLFLFLLPSVHTDAQNLTGYWKGTITNETNGNNSGNTQQLEMNLTQKGTVLEGCSHDYTIGRQDYCRASLKGSFDKEANVVKTFGVSFLEKRSANGVDHVLFNARLVYRRVNGKEMLIGRIIQDNEGIAQFFFNSTEKIVLYKVGPLPNPADKCYFEHIDGPLPEPEKKKPEVKPITKTDVPKTKVITKENIKTPPPVVKKTVPVPKNNTTKPAPKPVIVQNKKDVPRPSETKLPRIDSPRVVAHEPEIPRISNNAIARESAMRDKNVVKVIDVKVPVIKIELYDNGEIDGDTVSVIHNGKVIISNQMLTSKPITINLNLDDGEDIHEITMFAHNLGRIPPNTALMIVTAGNERYELRTSQDLKKNAVVVFEYKPGKM